MANFDDTRKELDQARTARDLAAEQAALARERSNSAARKQKEFERSLNPQNQDDVQKLNQLKHDAAQAAGDFTGKQQTFDGLRIEEKTKFGIFADFTDPRSQIKNFNDKTPILMMPVRIETRFKQVKPAGAVGSTQLWVRIYPDDCWIDTFDPTLTENEVANGKSYWVGIWKAGPFEDQQRAAWRDLVNSQGSGRATWIIANYEPVNGDAKPDKALPTDVILIIATETPLTPVEEPKVLTFWRDTWIADGDTTQTLPILEGAVGVSRAQQIIEQYKPANFDEAPSIGFTRDQITVSATVAVFPVVNTKLQAWSAAPRIDILPERFVFIGYQGGKPTVIQLGDQIPSPLIAGPDPAAPENEQLRHDPAGKVIIPEEMKWMTDFDRAVKVGMGMRIDLNATQAATGFDRVLVVGIRLSADEEKGQAELETLLRHHWNSRKGFAVVPQGTPTNNTEAVGSGFGRLDNPDDTFDDLKAALITPESDWLAKSDGQWIAEYLGIDPMLFSNVHEADSTDQLTQRAMNTALWPATFGYWMEGMMAPFFTKNGIEQSREFFNRYVVGSGAIPAIRIGTQPYGILPATTISRMDWLTGQDDHTPGAHLPSTPFNRYLRELYPILTQIQFDWQQANMGDVSFVGKNDDPHKLLLDIVGLHPGSVEWSQRYTESLKTVFNRLNLKGFGVEIQPIIFAFQYAAARELLRKWERPENLRDTPPILEKIFFGKHYELKGGIVDDQPLSDTALIRAYTETDQNYVQWLIDAAKTSLNELYQQNGFKDDKPPVALLYILLRYALQLGYDDTGIRLREDAGILTATAATRARVDNPILHVAQSATVSESRYASLYAAEPTITGDLAMHEFIASQLAVPNFVSYLNEQLPALEKLKTQTTARLERAFANHIDCCSYRLDAWMLGLVNYQLQVMRQIPNQQGEPVRRGVYLGAYGWLENLRPENKVLTPVTLEDPELKAKFADPAEPPLMRDSTNEGFIHAPSLNHAVAAAVLRNAFISNASDKNRQTMAVNLTSERVRTAVGLLDGIRAGQGLADLLGYQFERGLHDRHNLAEVDQFILDLRKAFPLRADHMKDTKTAEGDSIEVIEARNVLDGLALVEQMKTSGKDTYPFGKTTLPPVGELSPNQLTAINLEANRLLESHDAVADLALSEGVFQAVLGNYDRVASTYDAYARGNFPPEPEIIRTPLNGIGVTHRVALHLNAQAVAPAQPTPRSLVTPEVNEWLAGIMPDPAHVGCVVSFRTALTGFDAEAEVTLDQLGLKHVDLVAIIRDDDIQSMTELDDRIVAQAVKTMGPRPDHPITIAYQRKLNAPFSVFEVMALVRNVRRLITRSRPLKSTDMTLANEATSGQDAEPAFDSQRLADLVAKMAQLRDHLVPFQAALEVLLADLTLHQAEIVDKVDQHIDSLVALLQQAATFAVPQAGWGFAFDFRRRVFTAILVQAADLATRWQVKLDEFNARLNDETLLPGTATPEEHFNLLLQAELAISTQPTSPLPALPSTLRNDLINNKLVDFNAKRQQFIDLKDTVETNLSALLNHVKTVLLPVTDFDQIEYKVDQYDQEIVHFTEDVVGVLKVVVQELNRRLTESSPLINPAVTPTPAEAVRFLEDAAKILLGQDCRIFPQFSLGAKQGAEFENALNFSKSGVLFEHLTNPPDPQTTPEDFPVDTWLYGIARVREKMHAWEQVMMFAGSLNRPEPQLDALQLPFIADDRWLGLEFPKTQKLDQDRLLYTAHRPPGAFDKTKPQCGMLLDEWSEMIPTSDADTGIAMHYDRPNCEAPQTMLLVTPSNFLGAWQWDDLVNALNETLEFAKRRAIEPKQIDATAYGPFLPATIMASQVAQLTISANLALNNRVAKAMP